MAITASNAPEWVLGAFSNSSVIRFLPFVSKMAPVTGRSFGILFYPH
jgi:hypothetical protein